jgi:phage terminase large subunit GpA-like protein
MTAAIIRVGNAERIAADALAVAWAPPPIIDYGAFAVDHVEFDGPPFPGPYNPDLFPENAEILRALGPDDPCRIVTDHKSAQVGGTIIANIFTLASISLDAGDFMYVHPTEDNARRWSKRKLKPMMDAMPFVRSQFPAVSRDASDSVMMKVRRDGRAALIVSGASSPATLSQITVTRQVQDDLAKWVNNDAGDPEAQADSRSSAIEFAKIFKVSTPLVMPGCRITKSFLAGSQEYYEVPCPHCGEYQVLEWENLKATIDAGHVEDPHFVCVHCGCEIHDHHMMAIRRRGRWVAKFPERKRHHRSFHRWAAYSSLTNLVRITREYLAKKDEQGSLQAFLNDIAGEAYETSGDAPGWEDLRRRAEAIGHRLGVVPAGFPVLTGGIDVQGDRIEWQVVGWGRNYRSAVVDYGVIPGDIGDEETRAELDRFMGRKWRNAFGHDLVPDRVAIDANYKTDDVLAWVRRWPAHRVIAVRGIGREGYPKLALIKQERRRDGRIRKGGHRFYNVGTSAFKLRLYHNVVKDDPEGAGFVAFPKDLPETYYQGLTAESRKRHVNKRTGFAEYLWEKDFERNEPLDTWVYAAAALHRLMGDPPREADWDLYELQREQPAPEVQGDFEDLLSAPSLPPPPRPSAQPSSESPPRTARPARVRRVSRSNLLR